MSEASGPAEVPLAFSYHRGMAPILWVFVGLASIELFAVHLLVAIWSSIAALILSILSLASILWVLNLIRSLRRRPVLMDRNGLLLRTGTLRSVSIPFENLAAVRTSWTPEEFRRRDALDLGLLAHPNILVMLRHPLAGRRRGRPVQAIFHRLDDLPAFLTALARFQPALAAAK